MPHHRIQIATIQRRKVGKSKADFLGQSESGKAYKLCRETRPLLAQMQHGCWRLQIRIAEQVKVIAREGPGIGKSVL